MTSFTFTSERRESFSGWSRCVKVGDHEYSVSVQRGKSVRIPYKPRGQNRGWKWNGSVYRISSPANSGCVWYGPVSKSIGCRGLLIEAGIIENSNRKDGMA